MAKDDGNLRSRAGDSFALARNQLGGGRLGTYTALGAACGVVPLPWVPDATVRRVRGALVHDVTARRGLSLSPEARKILVEPNGTEGPRGFFSQGARFAASKVLGRLGPFALIGPFRSALGTYALGHLLQRYLDTARDDRSVRIDVEEARIVRSAIDQSLVRALTTDAVPARDEMPFAPEDLREQGEQLVDGVLISMAGLPGWVVRRLDAAFDEVLASVR
ncbi:MAG: hypothetical protein JWP97_624 [Labilithrix sp.]|nr:hypothetical protein [Labilithrix sp.]